MVLKWRHWIKALWYKLWYMYLFSHIEVSKYEDMTVVRPPYLHSGIPIPGWWHLYIEMAPYWLTDKKNKLLKMFSSRSFYEQMHWKFSWWRHQMEIFSSLLALCVGNSPVPGEFPIQRPVTQSFDVFCDLRLNKRLGKQSRRWWFETPSCSLWRHCNVFNKSVSR